MSAWLVKLVWKYRRQLARWLLGTKPQPLHEKAYQATADYLLDYYGPRCPDFEPGCLCCQRWRQFDELFDEGDDDDDE